MAMPPGSTTAPFDENADKDGFCGPKSGSTTVNGTFLIWFRTVDCAAMAEMAGGSLTSTVNVVVLVKVPSVTLTVMRDDPDWPAAPVAVMSRFGPAPMAVTVGTIVVLPETAVTTRLSTRLSTSLKLKSWAGVVCPRRTTVFVGVETNTGASFTGVTVSVKLFVAVSLPSLTMSEMVALPLALVAGRIVTLRSLPEPPKTSPVGGTSAGTLHRPVIVRFVATASASPTVNDNGPSVVSSAMVWLPTKEMLGALVSWMTVTVNRKTSVSAKPSLTLKLKRSSPLALAFGK